MLFILEFAFCNTLLVGLYTARVYKVRRGGTVGIAARYGLDGPGIGSRWGQGFPQPSRPPL